MLILREPSFEALSFIVNSDTVTKYSVNFQVLSLLRRVLPAVGRDADGHGAHGHGGGRGGGRGHHRGQVHPHHQRRRVRHLRHGVSYVQQVSFTCI